DLEQGEHACPVGGHAAGDERLIVAGDRDEDVRRFVDKVEGAGDDVAVGRGDDAGGRAHRLAEDGALGAGDDHVGAALGDDLHHAGGDPGRRVFNRLFLQVVQILGAG